MNPEVDDFFEETIKKIERSFYHQFRLRELKEGIKQLRFADGVISSYHSTSEQLRQIENRIADLIDQIAQLEGGTNEA